MTYSVWWDVKPCSVYLFTQAVLSKCLIASTLQFYYFVAELATVALHLLPHSVVARFLLGTFAFPSLFFCLAHGWLIQSVWHCTGIFCDSFLCVSNTSVKITDITASCSVAGFLHAVQIL